MTKEERARQIDAEEFRRESEQALARALAYSRQKREAEAARLKGVVVQTPTLEDNKKALSAILGSGPKPELHEHNGLALTITQWAIRLGISSTAMRLRVARNGIAVAVAQGQAKRGPRRDSRAVKLITFEGLALTRAEWAQRLGISSENLRQRIVKHGETAAIAMGTESEARKAAWIARREKLQAANQDTPGVGQNSRALIGTGGGSTAQDSPKITFPEKALAE